MNWNITFRIPVLTVIAAVLAFLAEGEIGVDFVMGSPSPVSGRGEDIFARNFWDVDK